MSFSQEHASKLKQDYPWIKTPLVSSAPMRLIAGPSLASAVTQAGGLGFIGSGSDVSNLHKLLEEGASMNVDSILEGILPLGVGFLNWGADLHTVIGVLKDAPAKPAALWLFASNSPEDMVHWTQELRTATDNKSKIWIQIGTVASALEVSHTCKPDVLVIQGSDAGGHGLAQSSSIITLLPEVSDALKDAGLGNIPLVAAGGIMDGRGVAAAMMLGASGVCMGTRFLASHEAEITQGYRQAVLDANDGGVTTVRTSIYDKLRGTTGWPWGYNARGVINKSFRDAEAGMSDADNKKLYSAALEIGELGWGKDTGRITTYAGTGVGLVKQSMPAGQIIEEVLRDTQLLLNNT